MKIKFYLLGLALLLVSGRGLAQAGYNKMALGSIGNSPSPANFSNGGTFDDVDKSTGTLRVSIPLYEIKVNDISVPISLSYSATGIKVNQEAGVAGMGWDLSAGGKIITNIQGRADGAPYGMYSVPAFTSTFDWTVKNSTDQLRLNNILDGKEDNAWDTYTYILPHTSGSYVKNGLTFPYNPMVNVIDKATGLINNTITTSDGLVYRFATGDNRTTTKIMNYDGSSPNYYQYSTSITDPAPQTWSDYDLSSITSTRFKDVVNFKYHQFGPGPRLEAKKKESYSESMLLYRQVYANSLNNSWFPSYGDQKYSTRSPIINKTVTTYNVHSRLDTIEYATGRVIFDYNANDVLGRDELDSILIYKKEDNVLSLLKKYEFVYDGGKQYGHYLVDLNVYDGNRIYQNSYQFNYNNYYLPVVPNSNSKAMDAWGFYNGATSNVTLLEDPANVLALRNFSHYPIVGNILFSRTEQLAYYGPTAIPMNDANYNWSVPYANRNYSFGYAISGTLQTVTTPSGALYQYEYEPHTYLYKDCSMSGYDPSNPGTMFLKPGGGIRIRSITAIRGHQNSYYGSNSSEISSKKIFAYGDSGSGYQLNDGHESDNNGTVSVPWTVLCNTSVYTDGNYDPSVYPQDYYKAVDNLILLSHPINDLNICNGSFVMYKSVTETDLQDANNETQTLGKTLYYSNLPEWNAFETSGWISQTGGDGQITYNPYTLPQTSAFYLSSKLSGVTVCAPYMTGNLGFKPEEGAGVYEIVKERQDESGAFQPTELRTFTYNYFKAPQNNELWSVYATSAGQLSGEIPTTTLNDDTYDVPMVGNDASTTLINNIDASFNHIRHGMDFTTRMSLMDMGVTQDFPNRYFAKKINLNTFSYCKKLAEETIDDRSDNSFKRITYTYDNNQHLMPTTITTTAATGDQTIEHLSYPVDYSMSPDVSNFLSSNPMNADQPILDYTTYKTGYPGTNKLIGGTYSTFTLSDRGILPNKVYAITPPPNTSGAVPPNGVNPWLGNYVDSTMFRPVMTYDRYVKGQVHQYTEKEGKSNVILYGYGNRLPVAKISNAGNYDDISQYSQDVAYTSFETADTCNWIYAGSPVIDTSTISGKKVYSLSAGAISKGNTTLPGKYIVSYWYKNGSAVTLGGATVGTAVIKSQIGAWTLAEQEVSNVGMLTVSGIGYIDELRFFPKEAQMTTYIYDPEIGLKCTLDVNSKPLYYEYDNMQRLKQIRDHNGNIIKAYKYLLSGISSY